jgi:hypothetical protein
MSNRRKETVAEFIARGGIIKKIDPVKDDSTHATVRKISNGEPAIILSMDDAEMYYGENKNPDKPKAKTKQKSLPDMSCLPEALKNKFIARLKEGDLNGEESEN